VAAAGLRHVAALAGVSIKTVSNVINGYPYIAADTRAKVEEAIRQLDYRPNLYARSLRGGRSGVIALAIPTIDAPYFAELGRSVARAAQRRGWTVFIDQTDGDPQQELAAIKGLGPHLIDGLIFSPLTLGPADLANQQIARPVVMLGERSVNGTADHVAIDNIRAARVATAHLIEIGRRRIAAIGDQPHVATNTARLRVAGYRTALAEAGLAADSALLKEPASYTREEGAKAMNELLALPRPPDAVFCFTDLLAIGAMRAVHDHGLRVPDDIAVMGFDDIAEGRFSVPSLSTIAPDKDQLAEAAVGLLERRLGATSVLAAEEVEINFELAVRESTGPGTPSRSLPAAAPRRQQRGVPAR
jgi:DNA-binding LacI/PurR family transcriptional regulator